MVILLGEIMPYRYSRLFECVILFSIMIACSLVYGYDVNTYIPKNATIYVPVVEKETQTTFPDIPRKGYFSALIEVESCVSLTNKKCWSPTATLATKRELGKGFGQLTKAYNADGSIRFDVVTALSKQYKDLNELNWNTIESRPDLQVKAMIYLYKQGYNRLYAIQDPKVRMDFADAAYNGGVGGVIKDRTLCSLKKSCDPQIWFNNVEKTCSKSKKSIYGKRNACDINREHVGQVINVRLPKYQKYLGYKS